MKGTLFSPRKVYRAQSHRPNTVRAREYEANKKGIEAAILKIKRRWRVRKSRAIRDIERMNDYQQLFKISPIKAKENTSELARRFDLLRDGEVEELKKWSMTHFAQLRNSSGTAPANPY